MSGLAPVSGPGGVVFRDVSKFYGEVLGVNRVTLELHPGITALVVSGWKYASRSVGYGEVSVNSPAGVPIFQFKLIIVAAGILLFLQGIAQVFRCITCIRTGEWTRAVDDIDETEKVLLHGETDDVLRHGSEAVDVIEPDSKKRS